MKATHRKPVSEQIKPNNHKQKRKEQREPGIVVHVYNPSTKQSDARVSIYHKFKANLVYIASSRPARTLQQNSKKKQTK